MHFCNERIKIKNSIMYFKVDEKGKYWLLFCSSLNFEKNCIEEKMKLIQKPLINSKVDYFYFFEYIKLLLVTFARTYK